MSRMPSAIWEADYSASRRKHHHRCRVCRRILKDGERVLMARIGNRKTTAIHLACGALSIGGGFDHRDLLEAHGMQHLEKCGWPEAKKWRAENPICRAGGVKPGWSAPTEEST